MSSFSPDQARIYLAEQGISVRGGGSDAYVKRLASAHQRGVASGVAPGRSQLRGSHPKERGAAPIKLVAGEKKQHILEQYVIYLPNDSKDIARLKRSVDRRKKGKGEYLFTWQGVPKRGSGTDRDWSQGKMRTYSTWIKAQSVNAYLKKYPSAPAIDFVNRFYSDGFSSIISIGCVL